MIDLLFGGKTAEKVLFYLENYDEAHASAVAKRFSVPLSAVQNQLQKFESAGIFASRMKGRTRLYAWNPRYPLSVELRAFLRKALSLLPAEEVKKYFRDRVRPRKSGKPI